MANLDQTDISEMNGVNVDKLSKELTSLLAFYSRAERKTEPPPFVIRKIHYYLNSNENNVYQPVVLSLGPYNHGNQAFQGLESDKWKILHYIATANQERNINLEYLHGRTIETYLSEMDCILEKTRSVYNDNIVMDGIFLRMMFLDACFLLGQVLWSDKSKFENLPTYLTFWRNPYFQRDMLLLENQIPFSAVEKVYEVLIGEYTLSSLRDKMVAMTEQIVSPYIENLPKDPKRKNFHHLLHLCHMYFMPIQNHDEKYHVQKVSGDTTSWRRACVYHDVGVRIREKKFDKNNPHSISDVTFRNNVMEIPHLHIDSNTVPLFENLVALEQTCPQYGNRFTAYAFFLSCIMSMGDDVALLVKKGIVSHSLKSDDEVSNLLSLLTRNVIFDFNENYYLKNMNRAVEQSYHNCLGRWVVRSGYYKLPSPGYSLLLLAACIYVLMSCITTFFNGLSYYNLRKY